MPGGKILERIEIGLRNTTDESILRIYMDAYDNSLSRKWLQSLEHCLAEQYHLEKNYCFMGFVTHRRDGEFILRQINNSIAAINDSALPYHIDDQFTMENTIHEHPLPGWQHGKMLNQDKFNALHRYFEDLQGVSGNLSGLYKQATAEIRWHIRQLNLLCHEFETWAISYRKLHMAPEWQRPSQLMCWLNAPRFMLDQEDYELFGIDTINRSLGGVFVGVNKAVGKHHWEVFHDEGRDSRINELTTSTMKVQTEASADFDIEWARDPGGFDWQIQELNEFRRWLIVNGFDPEDKSLTIGHPQIGQIDLLNSFGTDHYDSIWKILSQHLDVKYIKTSTVRADYPYCWSDQDFMHQQIELIENGASL
jgi:hypothetical protein